MKYSHSKAMAVFHKIVKLVKLVILMIIHIYAKISYNWTLKNPNEKRNIRVKI
ncbi:hypothetical protein BCLUESOX_989 [bacterium endosymbiont of Bathymodiolus sp. 5 South]|nr:hypothetical protein BCLUESOX_989 [bacterium endosymbiont of Bathymodiolus sp. 5 South]VVH63236.1 hypothetical protein BSPWISOX_2460 [uncultured Gammaproteobacteria bacterium]VVM27014.1 hypothetical protein BSPWISOXPB_10332 [uncultured Gammaproteobacteria bacterium]VVM27370.1 hypothetical protein BSPWISOXPB_10342 [uncultured Gammaproteobacteria bacterium]